MKVLIDWRLEQRYRRILRDNLIDQFKYYGLTNPHEDKEDTFLYEIKAEDVHSSRYRRRYMLESDEDCLLLPRNVEGVMTYLRSTLISNPVELLDILYLARKWPSIPYLSIGDQFEIDKDKTNDFDVYGWLDGNQFFLVSRANNRMFTNSYRRYQKIRTYEQNKNT